MTKLSAVIKRSMPVFLVLFAVYTVCMIAGMAVTRLHGAGTESAFEIPEAQRQALEAMFGPLREPLRNGSAGAFVAVMLRVFAVNLVGSLQYIVSGLFVIPPIAFAGYAGWSGGAALVSLKASSLGSLLGYLAMTGIESFAFIVHTTAGVIVGVALISPHRLGESSRYRAFKRARCDAGYLFLIGALILLIQAAIEVTYVRQTLLHGGTVIPLQPY